MMTAYELQGKRVWVAGHRGMVGSALVRRLSSENCEILTVDRSRLDLRDQEAVRAWMKAEKPNAVVLAAAKVGGIMANNTYPADFLYDNMMIEANVIQAAHLTDVEKLVFLSSSCVYPKLAAQPMAEEALLTGPLEPTNEWYAIAKIAGLKLCQAYRRQHGRDFISVTPANLYGPYDNFDLTASHVVPAMLRKIYEAKMVGGDHITLWGTGSAMRDFLQVDDCADAIIFLMQHYSGEEHMNIGTGKDVTIAELARTAMKVIGFPGELRFDATKPDGAPRKLMDVTRLDAMGWKASTSLHDGLTGAYQWFLENIVGSTGAMSAAH